MECGSLKPHAEYLTRSDIARMLKISTKQAGRLMDLMPTLRIGRTHRRVLRTDFDDWRLREREALIVRPQDAGTRKAIQYVGPFAAASSGSVARAAESIRQRQKRRMSVE